MADIEITRAHTLGLEGARAAAKAMEGELQRKFGVTGDWKGDTLHFARSGISGTFAVAATAVHLSVTLGFMAKAMKGSIESSVRHELERVFSASRQT